MRGSAASNCCTTTRRCCWARCTASAVHDHSALRVDRETRRIPARSRRGLRRRPPAGLSQHRDPSDDAGDCGGCVLVFIPSLGAFLAPDLLGGGRTAYIGNLIQSQFAVARDMPFGAALSFLLSLVVAVLLLIFRRPLASTSRCRSIAWLSAAIHLRCRSGCWRSWFTSFYMRPLWCWRCCRSAAADWLRPGAASRWPGTSKPRRTLLFFPRCETA